MDTSLNEGESNNQENKDEQDKKEAPFKKPIIIGKIGKLVKKILPVKITGDVNTSKSKATETVIANTSLSTETSSEKVSEKATGDTLQQTVENSVQLPYKEPVWSGIPESSGKEYAFEVLKNGIILETLNLMSKSYWVFGRITSCNICMQHPTISRYHAVLQYRKDPSGTESSGFYLYDLGSTHGTFLNKNRLKPKVYVRMQVGHMLKLGCSTRSYILSGPESDEEEESELTLTELKQKREEELQKRKLEKLRIEMEMEERKKREEEKGVDWGLGEDAEEETDLSENPFAQTNNEELYLDDPKKALRGFFEREGVDLEYDCSEQGMGQFLCKVELPLDDELGRPIVAEVLHKGKKKEAVVQCALEACRVLDRFGVLRQAVHESRKRKAKNWEENDYYDSDEDTFLDRTGTIEKKREKRMTSKLPPAVETYDSLLEKEKAIAASISELEKQLKAAQDADSAGNSSITEEDSLDTFMKELKQSKIDKHTTSKLKMELSKSKKEHANVMRLLKIAKPAALPALVSQNVATPSTSREASKISLPIIGKRKKIKIQLPVKPPDVNAKADTNEDCDEEEDEADREEEVQQPVNIPQEETSSSRAPTSNEESEVVNESVSSSSSSALSDEDEVRAQEFMSIKGLHNTMTFKKFEKILKKGLPPFADKHQEKLEKILNNLKKLAASEDRMHVDWKMLAAKKRKVMKLISDLKHCEPNERLEHKVSSELNRILTELNTMTEQKYKVIDKVKRMGNEIKTISEAIDKDFNAYKKEIEMKKTTSETSSTMLDTKGEDDKLNIPESTSDSVTRIELKEAESNNSVSSSKCNPEPKTSASSDENPVEKPETSTFQDDSMDTDEGNDDKKKKKNQRRIQQRQEKAEMDRRRGYEEDAAREDYSMWVPPSDQSGDGRTSLNDKFGY